jgi:hypothetical protein
MSQQIRLIKPKDQSMSISKERSRSSIYRLDHTLDVYTLLEYVISTFKSSRHNGSFKVEFHNGGISIIEYSETFPIK